MDQATPTTTPPPGVELGGQDASAGSGGFEICIDVGGDGSITVKAEPKAEEMAEPQGAMSGKPAKDIGEALAMALEIFKAGGQMPDAQGESAAMSAGFNKVKQVGM